MITEAALGAVFGELLKSILENIDKVVKFKPTLENLQSTLIQIDPVIQDIVKLNNKLGRPKEDLESLIRKMKEGIELVNECSNLRRRDLIAKVDNQQKLEALSTWLVMFCNINMQAQIARDQKQNLVESRRILSTLEKLPIDQIGTSSHSTPVLGEVNESENASGTTSAMHQDEQLKQEICKTHNKFQETLVGSPIIGDQYCKPSPIILEIVRTVKEFSFYDKFKVKNINNDIIFNLEKPSVSIHERYTLFDDHGNPVITLHRKTMTAHNRWEVFRGTSDQRNDLIFSIKKRNIIQLRVKLDVFLAENTEEKDYDFKVEGNLAGSYFSVYARQSRDTIAEVSTIIIPTILATKHGVVARVKPKVDFAFIVALFIVILSE